MEKKIGFIGLGNIGMPIAQNLIQSGYHLQVYNRTHSKTDELDPDYVTKCQTPADASEGAHIVITVVSDDEVLKEITLSTRGILEKLPEHALHISMSTVSPETSEQLAQLHEEAGSHYLAAPVFGRTEAAAARKLWICVSGDQHSKDTARPVLDCLGQGVIDFGESAGGANVVKIAGNFMIMASMEMMAEAYTLAEKNGLDREQVANFFGSTLFNVPIFQNYGRVIANKQYEPVGFKSKLGYKDARLAFKLSQASQTPMPIVNTLHSRLLSAMAKGWSETDWAEAVGRGVSEDAGV
ncbi:NAD(P)-dependent oxidoreductase [Mucilaginibacter sp. SG564]|uniref:NAD(P)-dependent oxidoreductase n=1 Tax=unclassified Mucilaginibacter TaxID=2617802 RepID=UPI0015543856|nr:NAD(P)-dependent oxidoreductase [Mucilaginibacter sp. SG564]NOW95677.1 3-hydroxyisobutyrate dehydrogenase-like beta-hydroxyacid dehydrogenase [Mucilaginibacter sp. SG564]